MIPRGEDENDLGQKAQIAAGSRWPSPVGRSEHRPPRPPVLSRPSRRGAAVVEFALVAPLIFLLIFASIEFGRLQMTLHGLNAAAREGCRTAVSWNASQQNVEQAVRDRMTSFGIVGHSLTTDPNPTSKAGQWEPITVRVAVTYDDVSWLPAPRFLRGVTLAGSSTLPQESDQPDS